MTNRPADTMPVPMETGAELTDEEREEAMSSEALIYELSVVLMRLDGNDGDPHQLLWTGGTVPEPWGDAWQRYEEQARDVVNAIGEGSARAMVAALRTEASAAQEAADKLHAAIMNLQCNAGLLRGIEAARFHAGHKQARHAAAELVLAATPTAPQQPEQPGEVHQTAPVQTEASTAQLRAALERIIAATHSHVDGRDLLAELHPRRMLDIVRRVDGRETWFEGDWLSTLWRAVKEARRALAGTGADTERHGPNDPAVSAVLPPVQAGGDGADPSNDAFEAAMRQAWEMVDPFNPPPTGTYARGSHEGICAALKTMRENYDRERAKRTAGVEVPAPAQPFRCAFDGARSLCESCTEETGCKEAAAGVKAPAAYRNKHYPDELATPFMFNQLSTADRAKYEPLFPDGDSACPHGIHMDNACGACVPPRGTTAGVGLSDGAERRIEATVEKLRRCKLGCGPFGQCKAAMHGVPSECASGVGLPDGSQE